MSYDVLSYMLIMMNLLFLFVVAAWYFNSTPKKTILLGNALKGTWQLKGKTPQGEPWYINHTFTGNTFSIKAQPTFSVNGNYRIVKEIEHLLILELFNITGDGDTQNRQMQIAIDPAADKIVIEDRTYGRVKDGIIGNAFVD